MDVVAEDQKRICDFAVLTARAQRLRERISAARRESADSSDAARDLEEQQLFAEDDSVFVRVGAAFVATSLDAAVEDAKRRAEEGSNALAGMLSELSSVDSELLSLKALLHSKFGNAIQLEL